MNGTPRERAPGPEDEAGSASNAPTQPPPTGPEPSEAVPHWYEMADAVWLAAHWSVSGRTAPQAPAPADDVRPTAVAPAPSAPPPSVPTAPTGGEPGPPTAPTRLAPDPEGPAQLLVASPVLPPARPGASRRMAHRAAALARSLHRLRRRVASRDTLLLDEELTAERMATDWLWMPWLRYAEERAFDLVVFVDDGPTMGIWREEITALRSATELCGAFRSVRTARLTVSTGRHGVPTPGSGTAVNTVDPAEFLDGRGNRLFLVVTDGLGRGWATADADDLLQRLGDAGPTALLHLLPPHMRHRSSLHPHAAVLESGGFGAANNRLSLWPPPGGADPTRPLPQTDVGAVAVPVLSLKPGSFTAWSELVVGGPGVRRTLPAVVAGTLSTGEPAPGLRAPRLPHAAPAAVRGFFNLATPDARRLATRLAAIPFDFDLIQQMRDRMMPDTGAEHLAEILMGGLIDWGDAGTRPPEFADGIREALLATTTRAQLAMVVLVLGELPVAGAPGVALRAALRDPAGAELPNPDAGSWWRAELAVMRALSGPYARRARRIEAGGVFADEGAAVESVAGPPMSGERRTLTTPEHSGPATMDAILRHEAGPSAPPAVMLNVPPRNSSFTGRTAELQDVADLLARQGTVCVLAHALHGLGGVGTSELALEYVYRHARDHDLVCWISAERESLVRTTLASLAAPLGIGGADGGAEGGALAFDAALPAVLRALRTGAPYDRWLLVVDNAEDIEAVRRHLPLYGPGKILVTSRNHQWASVADSVTLGVFERTESVALLRRRSPDIAAEDADRLAETLGDLPFAVEQAGTWLGGTGQRVDEYLELLQLRSCSAMGAPDVPPGWPLSVAAVWDIALERLGERHPDARRLLDLCASMAPEPIPLVLLGEGRLRESRTVGGTPNGETPFADPPAPGDAIRALSRLALAKVDLHAGTLRLHRLLRAVLLAEMPSGQLRQTQETTHRLLAAAPRGDFASAQAWPAYRALLPHVLASQAVSSTDTGVRALVHDTVLFLRRCGDHEGAIALGRQAWTAWLAASGEESNDVVRMAKAYGSLLRWTGRITESVPLTENALEVSRRTAPDTVVLVDSLCELADARRHQGRFQEARDLSREATELARSMFGSDDPVTLRAAHGWGAGLRLCGQFGEALALDRENARRCEMLNEPADHLTVDFLNTVSLDLRESGDYPGARDLQEDLHRWARSELGPEDPLFLRVADNLAVCRRRDGALSEAALLSEETLRRCTDRHGPDHPDSLSAAVNAAVHRRLTGELDRSRQLDETTTQRLTSRFGEDHLCTLVSKAGLAATMRAAGHLDHTRELEDDIARRLEATLGPRHIAALTVAIGRANTAYGRLDFEQAYDIDETTLPLLAEVVGEQHPLRLACTANLALDLRVLGRAAEADELQHTVVEGFTAVVRADHPWLLAARQRRRIECDTAYVPW